MKHSILLFTLCFLLKASFGQTTIPEDWKLSSKQANKMMQYYSDCRDCPTSKATPDTAKENMIRGMFQNAKSIEWIDARYRTEDAPKYASRNWQAAARGGGSQVGGYTTRIMRVIDADDKVHYFDIVSICPPPAICDVAEQPRTAEQ